MKKIILIGTGNLGKRYLQAILNARGEFICHCYDIDREALDGVPEFLRRNNISSLPRMHFLFSDILGEIDRNALVIVASTARGRREMISEIATLQPAAMIIEKPVAQTAENYLHILNECRERGIDAFTHYTLRFQPFCTELKSMVADEKAFEFILSLPAMGLACVSIHYIDLFLWLFGLHSAELSAMDYAGIYEQKRRGFYDMYGEAVVRVPGRGTARFINNETDGIRTIIIGLNNKVISVYEDQRLMTIMNRADKKITQHEFQYRYTSQYMTSVVENYLNGDVNSSGELVTLEEALLSHRIIYDFMERSGNKDLNIT